MFICTYDKNKKDELVKKGFRLFARQNKGGKLLYTFEFEPHLFTLFSEEEKEGVFITNKMIMA